LHVLSQPVGKGGPTGVADFRPTHLGLDIRKILNIKYIVVLKPYLDTAYLYIQSLSRLLGSAESVIPKNLSLNKLFFLKHRLLFSKKFKYKYTLFYRSADPFSYL